MNAAKQELSGAGKRLAATPTAVFVAVLTAGFALASTAQHMGLYNASAFRRSNVVLACPRTSPAKSTSAGAHAAAQNSPAAATQSSSGSPATAADPQSGANLSPEKHATGKTGSRGGLSVPLPDFNAPELSRFISPL